MKSILTLDTLLEIKALKGFSRKGSGSTETFASVGAFFEVRVRHRFFVRLRVPLRTLFILRGVLQRLLNSLKNSFIKDF